MGSSNLDSPEARSDRLLKWLQALSAIAVPLVLLYLGNQFNAGISERASQTKLVETAIEILREPPTEERKDLRAWAIAMVDRYAGVPLTPRAIEELRGNPAIAPAPGSSSAAPARTASAASAAGSSFAEYQALRREALCKSPSTMGYLTWYQVCKLGRTLHPSLGP